MNHLVKCLLLMSFLVMAPPFAVAQDTPPTVTLDACGQIAGLSPDVMDLIEQRRGVAPGMAACAAAPAEDGSSAATERSVPRVGAGLTIPSRRT